MPQKCPKSLCGGWVGCKPNLVTLFSPRLELCTCILCQGKVFQQSQIKEIGLAWIGVLYLHVFNQPAEEKEDKYILAHVQKFQERLKEWTFYLLAPYTCSYLGRKGPSGISIPAEKGRKSAIPVFHTCFSYLFFIPVFYT